MKACKHCGGQVITNWGVTRCFQCGRLPLRPVPVFTDEEILQERRASHGVLQRANYSKRTKWD